MLFNPGMRHELEERRAKEMLREEEGNARKGRLGIDLESGVAVIPSGNGDRPADPPTGGDDHAEDPQPANDDEGAEHEHADDEDHADAPRSSVARRSSGREDRPRRTGGTVPSGKARRRATGGDGSGPGAAPVPTGKARHTR